MTPIMKHLLLSLSLATSLLAQETPLAEAYLINRDGGGNRVWIEKANKQTIQYRENPQSLAKKQTKASSVTAFFPKSQAFKVAERAFQNGNFKRAKELFSKLAADLKFVDDIPGNLATLAAYYELECARELGDYQGIEALLDKFQPAPLLNETHKTQLQLYPLYNAVRTKDWERLSILCKEWDNKELPPTLAIQVSYCKGLALKGQGKHMQALFTLNDALVGDYGRSRNLVKKAIIACLEIYESLPQVKRALKLAGTEDAQPNSQGAKLLSEARGLISLWNKGLGNGQKLPAPLAALAS